MKELEKEVLHVRFGYPGDEETPPSYRHYTFTSEQLEIDEDAQEEESGEEAEDTFERRLLEALDFLSSQKVSQDEKNKRK